MVFTWTMSILLIVVLVFLFRGQQSDKLLISVLLIWNLVAGVLGAMGSIYEVSPLTVPLTLFYLGSWALAYWYARDEVRNSFFDFSFGFWLTNFLFFLLLSGLILFDIDTPTFLIFPAIWSLGPLVGFGYFIKNQFILMGVGVVGVGSLLIYTYQLTQVDIGSRKNLKLFSIVISILTMVGFGNAVYKDSLNLEPRLEGYGTMQFEVVKLDELRVIGTENQETGESFILWLETNEWGVWETKSSTPTTDQSVVGIEKLFAISNPNGEYYEVYRVADDIFREVYIDGYLDLSENARAISHENKFNLISIEYKSMPSDHELEENLETIFKTYSQQIDDSLLKTNLLD